MASPIATNSLTLFVFLLKTYTFLLHKSPFAAFQHPPKPVIKGDVNGDGEVNISDVVALLNHLLTQP